MELCSRNYPTSPVPRPQSSALRTVQSESGAEQTGLAAGVETKCLRTSVVRPRSVEHPRSTSGKPSIFANCQRASGVSPRRINHKAILTGSQVFCVRRDCPPYWEKPDSNHAGDTYHDNNRPGPLRVHHGRALDRRPRQRQHPRATRWLGTTRGRLPLPDSERGTAELERRF